MKTARLFDSGPMLAEGEFDSHGVPVAPQSLYLAQLEARLGKTALNNIGYLSNSITEMITKNEKPLPPQLKEVDPLFGENLALHRPISASNMRGKTKTFSPERLIDGKPATYWAADDSVRTAVIELDMENPVNINVLSLGEQTGFTNRIVEYKVEAQVNSDWQLLAQGSSIGKLQVHHFPTVTAWKVRLTILKANAAPALKKFGLYHQKPSAKSKTDLIHSTVIKRASN